MEALKSSPSLNHSLRYPNKYPVQINGLECFAICNFNVYEPNGKEIRLGPEAIVTTVWKMAICKWGVSKQGILKCPVSHVLNFRGWIELIYDKITLIYYVKNAFNRMFEVQNIENGVCQNAPFANTPFANGHFPNGDYSCLWAK